MDSRKDVPAVMADNQQGGYLATDHLVQLGHRRIGFIARPEELSHSQGRMMGYMEALENAGVPFDAALVCEGGFRFESGKRAVWKLLDSEDPPTAIFAYNDIMAIGALRGAHERGLCVPDDFSVVGFDDIAQASFTCPALTTVFQDKFNMGKQATNLLIKLIEKQDLIEEELSPLEVYLVVRESTGPARIKDA
jgi:LacI family transcriptional regulator